MAGNSWINSASSSTIGKFGTGLRRSYRSFDTRERSSISLRMSILSINSRVNIAFRVHERTEGGNEDTCLNYVLSKLSFLPPPRRDVLITEQDIFLQSHRHDVEYLVTGGRGKRGATSSQLDEIEERCSQVEAALLGTLHL